ncbi:MAG: nitroreductase family protein [Eubacterium sp.]|nr:nitroreductase family protein [Eubacterium sp.]
MEFTELIEARRSIRHYDADKKVTKEQVEEMVEAAIQAPSWKNSQTARYYAVLSDEKIAELNEKGLPAFNAKNAEGAALIVTTFVANRAGFDREGNPDNEVGNGWGYYDCGLHNEHLVLKAKDMGLDTLIMGIRDADAIREILSIPETEIIVAVIAVGYATQTAEKPKRKTPEDIITFC